MFSDPAAAQWCGDGSKLWGKPALFPTLLRRAGASASPMGLLLHPAAQGGLVHGASWGLGQRGCCLRAGHGMWLRSSCTAACEVLQPPGSNPDPAPCGSSAGAAALGWEAAGAVAPRVPPPASRSPTDSRGLSRNGQIIPSGWGSWSCMGEGLCMAPPGAQEGEVAWGIRTQSLSGCGRPPWPCPRCANQLVKPR